VICFCLSTKAVGQNFILKDVNVDALKKEIKASKYSKEAMYTYFFNNYDTISEKKEVKHYAFPDYSICSFEQEFENGIHYFIESCTEGKGASIRIRLPKARQEAIVEWIENMYQTSPMDIKNGWNSDKTNFGPLDKGAGCYYEVKYEKVETHIKYHCGC